MSRFISSKQNTGMTVFAHINANVLYSGDGEETDEREVPDLLESSGNDSRMIRWTLHFRFCHHVYLDIVRLAADIATIRQASRLVSHITTLRHTGW